MLLFLLNLLDLSRLLLDLKSRQGQTLVLTSRLTFDSKRSKMGKPKYIQDTDWWKKTREVAVKALDQQWQETMDKAIIEALGAEEESMLKVEAGGRGSRGCRLL